MSSVEQTRGEMDMENWARAQSIFHQALDRPSAVRADFVNGECGDEDAVGGIVLRMLEEDARGKSVLDRGTANAAYELIEAGVSRVPQQMFGPYKLLRLLGEGGMGVVYLAEREDLGSQAAIKILRDSALSPMRRQRFAMEQQLLAHLNHPSIARLYDADTLEDGTPFIVMEYVEGSPLSVYVESRQLSVDDLLRLVRSICEAVQYAHSQAIIHRDLKPSNILVTDEGVIKLLDFGISRHMDSGLLCAGTDSRRLPGYPGGRLLTRSYSLRAACAPAAL
jgi:serine/threonine-protein kinase